MTRLAALLLLSSAGGSHAAEPRTIAIFTSPLAPIADATLAELNGYPAMWMVPVGVTFSIAGLDWSIDLAGVYGKSSVSEFLGATLEYAGMYYAAGPVFRTGDTPLNGWFFHPKLTFGVFQLSSNRMMVDTVIGADVGYQRTWGPLYLALIVGVGIGVGLGENDLIAGPWFDVNRRINPNADVVFSLNLHLVRLGLAF